MCACCRPLDGGHAHRGLSACKAGQPQPQGTCMVYLIYLFCVADLGLGGGRRGQTASSSHLSFKLWAEHVVGTKLSRRLAHLRCCWLTVAIQQTGWKFYHFAAHVHSCRVYTHPTYSHRYACIVTLKQGAPAQRQHSCPMHGPQVRLMRLMGVHHCKQQTCKVSASRQHSI